MGQESKGCRVKAAFSPTQKKWRTEQEAWNGKFTIIVCKCIGGAGAEVHLGPRKPNMNTREGTSFTTEDQGMHCPLDADY
jgi:hypothetical protein